MITATLVQTFTVANLLGEGALWDAERQCFWWTDIESSMLYRARPGAEHPDAMNTPERLCAFAPIAGSDTLLCAFESGFGRWQPGSPSVDWWHKLDSHPGVRLNDGRTDRQGRFWCGGLQEAATDGAPGGVLWSVDQQHRVTAHRSGIRISNSIAFSPDGTVMHFTDTPSRCIERLPLDLPAGTLGAAEPWVHTEAGSFPDGSTVDSEGRLWNAQWGGSRVVCYDSSGEAAFTLELPCTQATCVAFGGAQLDHLLVTTARQDLDDAALSAQPQAGHAFLYKTNVTGLADAPFQSNLLSRT